MRTVSANPEGIRLPGEIVEVTAEEGKQLIDGHYAEEMADEPSVAVGLECMAIEAPERAVLPRPARRPLSGKKETDS